MSPDLTSENSFAKAPGDTLVSFSVVCQPKSGVALTIMRRELSLQTIDEFTPTTEVPDLATGPVS